VTLSPFAVDTTPISRSPLTVVVIAPLLADVPVPDAVCTPSAELEPAIP
jgi:hypothetical protein